MSIITILLISLYWHFLWRCSPDPSSGLWPNQSHQPSPASPHRPGRSSLPGLCGRTVGHTMWALIQVLETVTVMDEWWIDQWLMGDRTFLVERKSIAFETWKEKLRRSWRDRRGESLRRSDSSCWSEIEWEDESLRLTDENFVLPVTTRTIQCKWLNLIFWGWINFYNILITIMSYISYLEDEITVLNKIRIGIWSHDFDCRIKSEVRIEK